jgi:predicted transposase/invertase (TIGR01784 family)
MAMKTRTLLSFDWAVKRLLRNKANHVILEGFLSELLKRQILIKQLLESESNKETRNDKLNRVDILVENEQQELMIIELQFTSEYDYFHRMLYGTSKVITQFISEGDEYGKIRKVYSINIVYFNLGKGEDYVYHGSTNFRGMHTGDELQLTPKQHKEFGVIEAGNIFPEYYILEVSRFNDIAKDTLDEWIYYLKNGAIQDDFKAQGLAQAREILTYDKLSDEDKRAYDRAIDNRRSERSRIYTAKSEGLEEGLQKGREKGLEEGLQKVVINAHRAGLPVATICTLTGLPEDEVQKIIKNE